ncbi:MAG TPA: metalloregulator ArsR/SmtB family transcription factor [Terriglobales bacterium]|jgi:ArsR family transcriptional regulator|nr:metalloregulator ArsR/SmtB family transcription factor [Terriglobales bacterium]
MPVDTTSEELFDLQLKALADPARRKIIKLLRSKGRCSCEQVSAADPGMCVCDLEIRLGLTQPTITHHVQVLRDADLISARKLGRWVYCRRNEKALDRLGAWLRKL